MASVSRSLTINAAPSAVWELASDPHHRPRWWPGVTRVENVSERRFTDVYISKRGRPVRLDFDVVEFEAPRRLAWEQELIGTPFERFLRQSRYELKLEQAQASTRVTLAMIQRPRGVSRAGGGLLVLRAARQRADDALRGLAALLG
jgi:uncharacterized protein YndB with AHSA1/START domain